MKVELEHVAVGSVWRVTVDAQTLAAEIHIRTVVDFEIRYQARWCRGCAEHRVPALGFDFINGHPAEVAALAEVNEKLRDLMAVVEFN